MEQLIGLALILFFVVNLVAGVIIVYKENKTENRSFFKAFIFYQLILFRTLMVFMLR